MANRQPEPPTPLRTNADFRSFLTATPRINNPTVKPTSSAASTPSHPQKSSKRQEHSQRYFAKQAARQQEKESKDGTTPDSAAAQPTNKPKHTRHHYRDRARERRTEAGQDEEAERLTAAVDEESSKFLGGDVEHTHLVRGLDVQLLQRTREEDEKREQDRLDALAQQMTERKEEVSVDVSKPAAFRTPLAQSVWEWLHPPPVVPSDLFARGRMTYAFPLPPRPSRFAQLPLALAATVDRREEMSALYPSLASLSELPVSVLTSREELMDDKDEQVGGAVPLRVMHMVKAAMERKAARKAKRAHQSTDTGQSAALDGSDDEQAGDAKVSEVVERKESVEERRRRLMEQDDDDIFTDLEQPAPTTVQPQPPTSAATLSTIAPDAVFPSAAPNSKYFTTAAPSLTNALPHTITTSATSAAAPSHTAPLPLLKPPPSVEQPAATRPTASAPRQAVLNDAEDEDDMYTSMSFSATFAGDDDSDDEMVRRQDKEEARQQRLAAKRGKGGKRERGAQEKGEDRSKVERKREAKLDRQLAGVSELLKEGGKLTLDAFEKDSSQQSKRHRYG